MMHNSLLLYTPSIHLKIRDYLLEQRDDFVVIINCYMMLEFNQRLFYCRTSGDIVWQRYPQFFVRGPDDLLRLVKELIIEFLSRSQADVLYLYFLMGDKTLKPDQIFGKVYNPYLLSHVQNKYISPCA